MGSKMLTGSLIPSFGDIGRLTWIIAFFGWLISTVVLGGLTIK